MATTDPFGTSTFGGTSTPGVTSMGTSTPASTSTADTYKYKGQGWNDPLAQQMYQKYVFGGRGTNQVPTLIDMANKQMAAGMQNMNYQTPIDPSQWGTSQRGDDVEKMKAAYIAAGGQGTYEQLAGTYKTPEQQTAADALAKTGGTGSTNSLSSDVLSKMWR